MNKKTLIIMLGFCYLNPTLSQVKYEKEIRLNKEAIPQAAIDFISSLSFSKKVKWYKEFGLDNTSIEAKTKHEEKKYSIEFTPEGILEDVEIKIKSAEISSSVFANIQTHLSSKHNKYKIKKIQIQYVGDTDRVLSFLKNQTASDLIKTNYELVVSTKTNNTFKKFEYLFSEGGNFLKSSEIIEKNIDNIEF